MFVFKHACLNLRRHIWSHVVVGIILFLLILCTMITNTMYTSAKLFTKNYSKQFTTLVTILEPDLSNSTHEKKLTKEQYLKFGASDYVKGIKMVGSMPVSFSTLNTIASQIPAQFQKLEGDENTIYSYQTAANWLGADSKDLISELAESGMEIHSGSADLKTDECLISNEFAQLNQLKMGDSIQVKVTGNKKAEDKKLIVAGIYQSKEITQTKDASTVLKIQDNDIFTNWETLHTMNDFDTVGYNSVSYELTTMSAFDNFLKEVKAEGLPSEYHVITNEGNMKLLLNPVNGVGTLAGTILLGFLIFGNFGLVLFSIRKFTKKQTEICVLRNIGITKAQLIKSSAIELFVVTVFSFGFAFLTADWVVQPIADWQLMNQRAVMGNVDQLFSVVSNGTSETIASIPMIVNRASVLSILGITGIYFITAISVDSYKLFKFETIECLLERNLDE